MQSILELILGSKYTTIVEHGPEILQNPNPKLAELILNYTLVNVELIKNNNPGLTEYLINLPKQLTEDDLRIYWKEISSNNNPGLTEHLLNNKDKLDENLLIHNNNPGLTNIIIEIMVVRKISGENNNNPKLTDLMVKFGFANSNNNPLLAPYIIKGKWSRDVCDNTCSLLAYYIMSGRVDWRRISGNSNPGLTNIILKNEKKLHLNSLATNSNPELTDLIIKLHKQMSRLHLARNNNPKLAPLIINYCEGIDLSSCSNPGLTEHIINSKLTYHIYENNNPQLAELILRNLRIVEIGEMSDNPNPGLTKELIKHEHYLNEERLAANTNPELAPLIIKHSSSYDVKSNNNPGLTEHLLSIGCNPDNTNPLLADMIINMEADNRRMYWSQISRNPNTGLTDFIIKNKHKIIPDLLCLNTNPLLAELIMEQEQDWINLFANSNPGITDYLIKNKHLASVSSLCCNSNPALTDLIIELCDPENRECEDLYDNTNPLVIKHFADHITMLSNNPYIAIIDKNRMKRIIATIIL